MKSAVCLSALASAAIVTGCANGNAIYRKEALDKDSLVLDAKQRLVANYDAEPWQVDPAAANRKYGPPRYIAPERIVCPEPSPDVAASLSTAITASLSQINSDGSRTSGDMGFAAAESLAQLGQRLATTQLLRDELADLCRSYANGAISTTNYTLRLAQLDEKMVTLLTAEMIAGAFDRDSVAISGSTAFVGSGGSGTPSQAQITAAETEVTNARADLATKSKSLTDHLAKAQTPPATADTSAKVEEWRKVNAPQLQVHQQQTDVLRNDYNLAQERVTRAVNEQSALQNSTGGGFGTPTARALTLGGQAVNSYGGNADSARQLVALQSNYLQRDKGGAIVDTCITRMNDDLLFPKVADPAAEKTRELTKKRTELARLQALQSQKRNTLDEPFISVADEAFRRLESMRDRPPEDPERRAAQKQLDEAEAALSKNYRTVEAEFVGRISELSAEISSIEEEIDTVTTGKSGTQLDFDKLCYDLIERFNLQSSTSQNARLELELKELEAGVQRGRVAWLAEQTKFCRDYRTSLGDNPTPAAERILEGCATTFEVWYGTFLGSLDSLPNTTVQRAESSSLRDDDLLLSYLDSLESTNARLNSELRTLRAQKPAQPAPAPSEPTTDLDDN